jgi:hypothetical protein
MLSLRVSGVELTGEATRGESEFCTSLCVLGSCDVGTALPSATSYHVDVAAAGLQLETLTS